MWKKRVKKEWKKSVEKQCEKIGCGKRVKKCGKSEKWRKKRVEKVGKE